MTTICSVNDSRKKNYGSVCRSREKQKWWSIPPAEFADEYKWCRIWGVFCRVVRTRVPLAPRNTAKFNVRANLSGKILVLKRSQDVHGWSSNVPPTASIVVGAERSLRDCWITIAETAFEHFAEIVVVNVRMARR